MIHIAPWEAAQALFDGAGALLAAGGVCTSTARTGATARHTAPSNEAFDAQLRANDPRWGVRDMEDVEALGKAAGLVAGRGRADAREQLQPRVQEGRRRSVLKGT